jgi:hypothetical protein
MEEKDQKTEVAQQPAEATMSNEAMMQMMKHLWPDTNEQRDKEYWRNLHKELLFHYESEFGKESNIEDAFSKALIYARFAMNEIQSYERNGFQMQTKEAKEAEHGE